jgi:predicted RNase H-like HicB family nuclease
MMQRKRKVYSARAQRDGKWWAISVKGLPGALSQVRRLDQAEHMAREVIALVLDVLAERQQKVTLLLVREAGLTVRDAATVLGVSLQGVSQLTFDSEKRTTKAPTAKGRLAS